MTQFEPDPTDDPSHEPLTDALLVAVESVSGRAADEASIRRVVERAGKLRTAFQPVVKDHVAPVRLPARKSRDFRNRLARAASWAGIVVAVGCLAVGSRFLLGNRAAFAQVQEKLAKVGTIRFVYRMADTPEQQPGRVFVIEPDRYREELLDGRVFVTDLRQRMVLELDTNAKTGEIYSLYDVTERHRRAAEMISTLRNVGRDSVENAGRRQDGRQEVIDYRIVDDRKVTLMVTVDAVTKLPVRIEQVSSDDGLTRIIATDFVFDQPIDEALVRIAPPEGYRVTHIKSAARTGDGDLIVSSDGLGPVTWGMKTAEVIKLLGEPDGIKPFSVPILQFTKSGDELVYDSQGFRIIVASVGGVEHFHCYGAGQLGGRSRAFAGRTDKEVCMGATVDDVIKAYGEPDIRQGLTDKLPNGNFTYMKERLLLGFFDGRLSYIGVSCPQLRPDGSKN